MSSVSPDDRSAFEKRMNINTALAILARVHTRTDPAGGLFVEFGAQPDGIVPLPLYVAAWRRVTFRPDALSARHPQLVVLDLLYIAVAQRTHDRAHAAFQRTARAVAGHKAGSEAK